MRKATPWIVIPIALAVMAMLMYVAFCADCTRLWYAAAEQVADIDYERMVLEKKFSELAAIHEPGLVEPFNVDRRDFSAVIHYFRKRTSSDASSPVTPEVRRYRDQAAGLINRWEVLTVEHKAADDDFRAYMNSFRGRYANPTKRGSGLRRYPGSPE